MASSKMQQFECSMRDGCGFSCTYHRHIQLPGRKNLTNWCNKAGKEIRAINECPGKEDHNPYAQYRKEPGQ